MNMEIITVVVMVLFASFAGGMASTATNDWSVYFAVSFGIAAIVLPICITIVRVGEKIENALRKKQKGV